VITYRCKSCDALFGAKDIVATQEGYTYCEPCINKLRSDTMSDSDHKPEPYQGNEWSVCDHCEEIDPDNDLRLTEEGRLCAKCRYVLCLTEIDDDLKPIMKRFSLRLPEELHSKVKAEALRHNRSINGQILQILFDWLIDKRDTETEWEKLSDRTRSD
jgi:hypothetical protein